MDKVQRINMNDREHGLRGLGDISYFYTYKEKLHKLEITIHSLKQTLTYYGEEAKKYYYDLIRDSDKQTIDLVKRLAADSIGIPVIRLKENSRKLEVVWAKYLVMWYVNKYLKYSLKETGLLFSKDHATVIHAKKQIAKPDIYLHDFQRIAKKNFILKLSEYNLTNIL